MHHKEQGMNHPKNPEVVLTELLKERADIDRDFDGLCSRFQDSQLDLTKLGDQRYTKTRQEAEEILYALLLRVQRMKTKKTDDLSKEETMAYKRAIAYVESFQQVAAEFVDQLTAEIETCLDKTVQRFANLDDQTRMKLLTLETHIIKNLSEPRDADQTSALPQTAGKNEARNESWLAKHGLDVM